MQSENRFELVGLKSEVICYSYHLSKFSLLFCMKKAVVESIFKLFKNWVEDAIIQWKITMSMTIDKPPV